MNFDPIKYCLDFDLHTTKKREALLESCRRHTSACKYLGTCGLGMMIITSIMLYEGIGILAFFPFVIGLFLWVFNKPIADFLFRNNEIFMVDILKREKESPWFCLLKLQKQFLSSHVIGTAVTLSEKGIIGPSDLIPAAYEVADLANLEEKGLKEIFLPAMD